MPESTMEAIDRIYTERFSWTYHKEDSVESLDHLIFSFSRENFHPTILLHPPTLAHVSEVLCSKKWNSRIALISRQSNIPMKYREIRAKDVRWEKTSCSIDRDFSFISCCILLSFFFFFFRFSCLILFH